MSKLLLTIQKILNVYVDSLKKPVYIIKYRLKRQKFSMETADGNKKRQIFKIRKRWYDDTGILNIGLLDFLLEYTMSVLAWYIFLSLWKQ